MFGFLTENAATIVVSAVLVLIVALIIRNMVRRKRQGKCAGCDGCASAGSCHAAKYHK